MLALTASAGAAVRVEAYRGQPFGVGRVTIDLPPGAPSAPGRDDRFALVGDEGRVLYPVISDAPVRRIARRILGIQTPWRVTFYFMFRGDEPLAMTVYAPTAQRVTVQPRNDPREFRDLADKWWEARERRYKEVFRQSEYPVVVENYLAATWARRLGNDMPETRTTLLRPFALNDSWAARLTADEAYRSTVERDLLLGDFGVGQPADLPLPEVKRGTASLPREEASLLLRDAKALELPAPNPQPTVPIEPIASHVPNECFYLRFGSFTNYLWFRDFLAKSQGDLGNMIVPQSVSYDNGGRLQEQLAIRESQVARVMGPAVIRDVAIIGLDAYMRDGAAMGILFHANNSMLLANNIQRQRSDALANHADATDEKADVAGHEVSYLSTPDGQLRSYYASDGDFHLVTTSHRIVERFYEAAGGNGPLAAADEFQSARAAMPLTRDDTIFLYLSSAFLENLASPAYRVELDRRLRSIGEMRAMQIARWAAWAEGRDARTIDELVAAGLLPRGFGQRPDGSQLVETDKGWHDSIRGVPGAMRPVPDVPVDRITRAEADRYAAFTQAIEKEVGRFSPITAALQRQPSPADDEWDRITIDVLLSPYSQTNLAQWSDMLGPATKLRVAPIAGDIISAQLVLNALGEPRHFMAGLRDFRPPFVVRQGEVAPAADIADITRAYVGVWPRPYLLDRFLGSPSGPPDAQGIARNDGLLRLWSRRADDFFLFAFQREMLLEVGPQLAMIQAERPAQLRLRLDDPSQKQVATLISALGYMRDRSATASGARFMNSLVSQLHVPPEQARTLAEQLVGGTFHSPLGGDYELIDPMARNGNGEAASAAGGGEVLPAPAAANGRRLWASTATPPANRFLLSEIPADYQMPLMDWFRGLDLEVARLDGEDAFTLHAELDMVHQDVAPPAENGNGGFNLSGLGSLLNGLSASPDDAKPPAAADDELPLPTDGADK